MAKYDEKKASELWSKVIEVETQLRAATKQLSSSPKSSTKQKWEIEYDNFAEAREAYEQYMEDLADSIELTGE